MINVIAQRTVIIVQRATLRFQYNRGTMELSERLKRIYYTMGLIGLGVNPHYINEVVDNMINYQRPKDT